MAAEAPAVGTCTNALVWQEPHHGHLQQVVVTACGYSNRTSELWRMTTVVARHGGLQSKSLQAIVTPFWSLSACSARACRHVQTDWGLVALMSNLRLKSPKRVA